MNAVSEERGDGDSSSGSAPVRTLVRNSRLMYLSLLLVGATLFTWVYPFHRDLTADSKANFWQWLVYPHERNAFLREERNGNPRQLYSLFYEPGGQMLWAGATGGDVLVSADQGKTWSVRPIPRPSIGPGVPAITAIRKIHFFDANNGWVQTFEYSDLRDVEISDVYWTVDAGRNWLKVRADKESSESDPFASETLGYKDFLFWKSGEGLALLGNTIDRTSDYGRRWEQSYPRLATQNAVEQKNIGAKDQGPPDIYLLVGIAAGPNNQALASAHGGKILVGAERGKSWVSHQSVGEALLTVESLTNGFCYAVGDVGHIMVNSSSEDLAKWEVRSKINSPAFVPGDTTLLICPPARIRFTDPTNGWLLFASENPWQMQTNYLLRTTNGGYDWELTAAVPGTVPSLNVAVASPLNTNRDVSILNAMAVQDANTLWLTGQGFQLLHTTNGGVNWDFPMLSYRSHPPGWYWLVCGLVAIGLVGELTRKPTVIDILPRRILQPDAPIENPNEDSFGFLPIARALARFFQNPDTTPPFTVALTGPWGTGKSSLMNLIRDQLKRSNVRTVWFNAWHNQNEESVFASLLKNITEQAIPSKLYPAYWPFFLKLVWIRTRRRWILSFGLVLFLGIGFGLSRAGSLENQRKVITDFAEFLKTKTGLFSKEAEPSAPKPKPTTQVPANETGGNPIHWPLILSAVPTFIALWRALRGISAKPEEMLLDAAKGASVGDLGAKVSFQMRFKEEFNDVTEAFGDKQLVIFIDDLDRCAPEKILQMMEAVNFLVSAGKCFVVLGLSPRQIEAGLSLAFRRIASEIELEPMELQLAAGVKDEAKQKRLAYARFYLKKLINLQIRVPKTTADDIARKIAPELSALPEDNWPLWRNRLKVIALALGFFLVGSSGFYFGHNELFLPKHVESKSLPPPLAETNRVAYVQPSSNEVESSLTTNVATLGTNVSVISATNWPANLHSLPAPPKFGWSVAWWCGGGIIVIFTIGLYFALRRLASLQFKDSDEFLAALRRWKDEISLAYPTGRESVRFVNLVRYMALRARGEDPILTEWEIFRKGLRRLWHKPEAPVSPPTSGGTGVLSEANVVAFSAHQAVVAHHSHDPKTAGKQVGQLAIKLAGDIKGDTRLIEGLQKKYSQVADEVAIN